MFFSVVFQLTGDGVLSRLGASVQSLVVEELKHACAVVPTNPPPMGGNLAEELPNRQGVVGPDVVQVCEQQFKVQLSYYGSYNVLYDFIVKTFRMQMK